MGDLFSEMRLGNLLGDRGGQWWGAGMVAAGELQASLWPQRPPMGSPSTATGTCRVTLTPQCVSFVQTEVPGRSDFEPSE